jgi:hypothetical protein
LGEQQSFNMHVSHAMCASLLIFAPHKQNAAHQMRRTI